MKPSPSTACIDIERFRRRAATFRRLGALDGPGAGTTISRALTEDDLRECLELVHRIFVDSGYILPCASGMRLRLFEALPETATFMARQNGRVVAVVSVAGDSLDAGLPSSSVFGSELRRLACQGRRVVEITNLAIDPHCRHMGLFFDLMRCCMAQANWLRADDLFIAVSPEHAGFFRELMQFEPLGGRRLYCAATEDIVQAMRLDLTDAAARVRELDALLGDGAFIDATFFTGNPFRTQVPPWARLARGLFRNTRALRRLFADSGFLRQCTYPQLQTLRRHWGPAIVDAVLGIRRLDVAQPRVGLLLHPMHH